MRHGQIGPFFHHHGEQLQRPDTCADHLQHAVLAPMFSDDRAGELVKFQKFTHLIGISGGDDHLQPSGAELVDDRKEKGHMRGVIQINPDPFSPRRARGLRP